MWGDVRTWIPPSGTKVIFVAAFPPCTNDSISGVRDHAKKRGMMLRDSLPAPLSSVPCGPREPRPCAFPPVMASDSTLPFKRTTGRFWPPLSALLLRSGVYFSRCIQWKLPSGFSLARGSKKDSIRIDSLRIEDSIHVRQCWHRARISAALWGRLRAG